MERGTVHSIKRVLGPFHSSLSAEPSLEDICFHIRHGLSGVLKQFFSPVVCDTEPGWMKDAVADAIPSLQQFSDIVKR